MTTAIAHDTIDLVLAGPLGSLDPYIQTVMPRSRAAPQSRSRQLARRLRETVISTPPGELSSATCASSFTSPAVIAATACRLATWSRKATSA